MSVNEYNIDLSSGIQVSQLEKNRKLPEINVAWTLNTFYSSKVTRLWMWVKFKSWLF